MSTTSFDRPGTEVTQEFRNRTVTVLVPSMPSTIIGAMKQVVEGVDDTGALVTDSKVTLPAMLPLKFVASVYTGAGGLVLELRVNNAAARTITIGADDPTPEELVDQILTAAIPGLTAVVEESGGLKRTVLMTVAKGDNTSIEVGSGTAAGLLTAFTIRRGWKARGIIGYTNTESVYVPKESYPDPRGNLDLLEIDYSTVRAFIANGSGSFVEAKQTEGFLVGATSAVSVFNDGDGDNLSPYLDFTGANFSTSAAVLTGTVAWTGLSYPGDFGTSTLELRLNGNSGSPINVTVTFASPGNAAAAASAINSALGANGTCVLNGSNQPVITTTATGSGASIEVLSGTINETTIGLPVGSFVGGRGYRARAQGNLDLSSLSYPNPSQVSGRVLRMAVDDGQYQQITFPTTGIASAADIVTAITNVWGTGVASLNAANHLVLLGTTAGTEGQIRIDKTTSDSTLLNTGLGLTSVSGPFNAVDTVFGTAHAPQVGDTVYVDGLLVGEITEVPVSPTNRLRLSQEQLLTFTGTAWYIVAQGLENDLATSTRPGSNLYVDTESGQLRVRHGMFRATDGTYTATGPLGLYIGYTALRKDVTPTADGFNMIRVGSITDLENLYSPIDTQNPLGLGLYLALLNAPGVEMLGVGVDETSATAPEGTLDAFIRTLEYMESKDVYTLTVLTHNIDVGDVLDAHVTAMSEPANRLERVGIFNPDRPSRKSDTVVASTATANVSGAPTDVIDGGIADLQVRLAALGLPGPTYTENDGVFVEFESDTNKYLVQSITGTQITINDGSLSASNTFYYDAAGGDVFTSAIVDRPMTVKIRGAAIANRTDEATAYADLGRRYANRRMIVTAPDTAVVTIDSLDTEVEGYYLNAALAGLKAAKLPQTPLTESSVTGIKQVIGSHDRYSEPQLKIMSAGGLWIFYQESDSGPVLTRQQLTSDMTSIDTREDSITQALDFGAKLYRRSIRNFIGRYNITTGLLESLNVVVDALNRFLTSPGSGGGGVFREINVLGLYQSETEPDSIMLDAEITPYYPFNKMKVRFII